MPEFKRAEKKVREHINADNFVVDANKALEKTEAHEKKMRYQKIIK